jgi:Spy/CpxP family protein refolding chaperone
MAALTAYTLALAVLSGSPAHQTPYPTVQEERPRSHQERPSDGRDGKERWKWWLYDRAELGITDRQSADIDRIFEETIPGQRAKREELERLEAALAVVVKENRADVATVAQKVDRIETVRAELNKTRTVMLYRINLLLTPEQRGKLERLRARRDEERRRNPDHRR